MPPKHKSSKAATPPDQRLLVKGRWLGVPTTFFGVETDGGRYLAKATGPHKSKKDMVWMHFAPAGYGDKAYAPLSQVKKWMVTDEVALDPARLRLLKGGDGVNTTLCRTHGLKSGATRRPETERQGPHRALTRLSCGVQKVRCTQRDRPSSSIQLSGPPGGRFTRAAGPPGRRVNSLYRCYRWVKRGRFT